MTLPVTRSTTSTRRRRTGGTPGDPKRVVTYKARKASWFVVSGVREGEVFYRKTYHVSDKFMS